MQLREEKYFQKYLYCCMRVRCRGNVFTEPLPWNGSTRNQLNLNNVYTWIWSVVDNKESSHINLSSNVSNLWPTLFCISSYDMFPSSFKPLTSQNCCRIVIFYDASIGSRTDSFIWEFPIPVLYRGNRILKKECFVTQALNPRQVMTMATRSLSLCDIQYANCGLIQLQLHEAEVIFKKQSLILTRNASPFMGHKSWFSYSQQPITGS
jgi:hypothetical protein